ncbi:hypothetical protein [Luteibacter rhizovicinus]|uniref:hypothetical protein n=1 Tax=Luteibacter rhizovicinus TaxID=242606 RepID=UPI000AD393CA|nr:hypothetical protein [Luteibacter rhizovicinus]
MTTLLRNAIVLLLLMTAVTGVAYPAVVGGLSALLFPIRRREAWSNVTASRSAPR